MKKEICFPSYEELYHLNIGDKCIYQLEVVQIHTKKSPAQITSVINDKGVITSGDYLQQIVPFNRRNVDLMASFKSMILSIKQGYIAELNMPEILKRYHWLYKAAASADTETEYNFAIQAAEDLTQQILFLRKTKIQGIEIFG